MKRTNWQSFGKSAKAIKKDVKNMQHAYEFFKEFPEPRLYAR